jgi:REP element-mobilizing transposase RayT
MLKARINYGWTGWVKDPACPPFPPSSTLLEAWATEGIRYRSHRITGQQIQLLVSADADRAPVLIAQRLKGRLQHAWRQAETPVQFKRRFSLRSLGKNNSAIVHTYVAHQVDRSDYIDPLFRTRLKDLHMRHEELSPFQAVKTDAANYHLWFHLVWVVANRYVMKVEREPPIIRQALLRHAQACRCEIAEGSIMPDHIHLAVRGLPDRSPADVFTGFKDAASAALGRSAFWQAGGYAGSYGVYSINDLKNIR